MCYVAMIIVSSITQAVAMVTRHNGVVEGEF